MEMFTSENYFEKISLDQEADYILDNNSIKALLFQIDPNTRCRCFSEIHKMGDPNCKLCDGFGYDRVAKIIDIFVDAGFRSHKGGISDEWATQAYIKPYIYAKASSVILPSACINILSFIDGIPQGVLEVYSCDMVIAPRGTNGERKYVRLQGTLCPHLVKEQDMLIKRMPLKDKVKLTKGSSYRWRS